MKIRTRKYPTGKTVYQFDGGRSGGKRIQHVFDSKKEAEDELAKIKRERKKFGSFALGLSPLDRKRYEAADKQLAAAGLTLEEAVEIAIRHAGNLAKKIRLEDLALAFYQDRETRNLRERSMRQLRYCIDNLIAGKGHQLAHTFTREQVETWLASGTWSTITRRHHLEYARGFFRFATEARFCPSNPCDGIRILDRLADQEREIPAFAPAQVQILFSTALEPGD